MKKMVMALVLLVGCSCSTPPVAHGDSSKDKWVNITNAQNKVVAAVNQTDGKVEYYGDPKEAFEAVLGAYNHLVADIQKAQENAKKEAEAKAPKKKAPGKVDKD